MRKTYKILLVIFLILILKCITPENVQAVAFDFLDENGKKITKLELDINETKTILLGININVLNGWNSEPTCTNGIVTCTAESSNWDYFFGKLDGYEGMTIYKVKAGAVEGSDQISMKVSSTQLFGVIVDTMTGNLQVEVIDKAKQKAIEDALKFADGKNYSQLTTVDEKILYVGCLAKKKSDGDAAAWEKFLNETTAETRDELLAQSDQVTDKKYDELDSIDSGGIKALKTQVEADKKNITQEEADKLINQAGADINQAVTRTIDSLSTGISINRPSNVPFRDVIGDLTSGGGYYKPGDLDSATATKVENIGSMILTNVTNIGMVVGILILAILGIKYMLGSVEEKAEYKKDLIPYLIGAGLLFGITVFVKLFMIWGQNISNI